MNLAAEISSLETEIQSLRSENEVLKHNKAIIDFENESLRRQLHKANAERDNLIRRGEAIKSLLDQTGASLLHGLNKFHEAERALEEQRLAAANAELPKFLANGGGAH